jgi:hypothetical protein
MGKETGISWTDSTVLVFGFDEGDRPAAGTACAGCRLLGHWCPAKGMCGETALCLSCGRGEVCGQALSVEKMRSGFGAEMFEAEVGSGSGECRTIAIADADRVVEETAAVSDWAIKASLDPENLKRGLKGRQPAPLLPRTQKERKAAKVKKPRGPRGPYAKTKLEAAMGMKKTKCKPEEVVMEKMELEAAKAKAFEMAGLGESIIAIASATGWYFAKVKQWLVAEGMIVAKPKQQKATKTKPPAAATPRPAVVVRQTVGVQVSERHLDAFWAQCSLDEKALAFGAVLEAR